MVNCSKPNWLPIMHLSLE